MPVLQRDRILEGRTVSYQNIVLKVSGIVIPLRLKRHLAPRTVRIILQSLPIRGNAHQAGGMVYIGTEADSGLERGRGAFRAGEVSFLPGQQCICFFVRDGSPGKPMTPIGVMEGDTTVLQTVKPGDVIEIYEETP